MGQPKFARKKYETPNHPWQGERIKSEHELRRKFGLKNKTEIWKAQSRLRDVRGQARELISRTRNPDDEQAQMEAKRLLKRLNREGLIGQEATLNEVLGLDVERILNRRLQSQVYLKGMARTPKQARQFVSHGLVVIGERRVTVPSYIVRREEEDLIQFVPDASVADPDHPVRPKAPGAEALAEREVRVPHGTGADRPTESPTAGDAPVKTEAAGTVAPSQGERAENAAREAGPGEHPPAGEAKVDQPQTPAGEAKQASPQTADAAAAEVAVDATADAVQKVVKQGKATETKAEPAAKDEPSEAAKPEEREAKAEPAKPAPSEAAKPEEPEAKPEEPAAKAEPTEASPSEAAKPEEPEAKAERREAAKPEEPEAKAEPTEAATPDEPAAKAESAAEAEPAGSAETKEDEQ